MDIYKVNIKIREAENKSLNKNEGDQSENSE